MTTLMKQSTSPEVQALLRDLDKPSLHALSYSLRHPETWPDGFVWNYNSCAKCAMGLAHQLWKETVGPVRSNNHAVGASLMARTFAMPYEDAMHIFYQTHRSNRHLGLFPRDIETVTPKMVADQIDKYLATAE